MFSLSMILQLLIVLGALWVVSRYGSLALGGMAWLIQLAEKMLRKHPYRIPSLPPLRVLLHGVGWFSYGCGLCPGNTGVLIRAASVV